MRVDELFRVRVAETVLVEDGGIVERAKALFGVTHNPLEAGYILADGTMLDLSGRHHQLGDFVRDPSGLNQPKRGRADFMSGLRHVDHREINDLYHMSSGTMAMRRFMAEAPAIRFQPKVGFDVSVVPAPRQLAAALAAHFAITDDPVYIDVSRDDSTLASHSFSRKQIARIMPFIKTSLGQAAN